MKPAFTRVARALVALMIVFQTLGAAAVASERVDPAMDAISEVQGMPCDAEHSVCPGGQLCNPALVASLQMLFMPPLAERMQDPYGSFATFLAPPGPPPPLRASP